MLCAHATMTASRCNQEAFSCSSCMLPSLMASNLHQCPLLHQDDGRQDEPEARHVQVPSLAAYHWQGNWPV
jgi:hypothetical protein